MKSKNVFRTRTGPLNVMLFATMSAGKSAFINSLVGSELLHCANKATTATIAFVASIHRDVPQSAACYAF